MNIDEKKEWETFIDEGTKYLRTAVNGAAKRKNVFTPEILYNIAAICSPQITTLNIRGIA